MEKIYLGLAVAGAVLPFYFFRQPVDIDTLGLLGWLRPVSRKLTCLLATSA